MPPRAIATQLIALDLPAPFAPPSVSTDLSACH